MDDPQAPDAQLLTAFARGDREALGALAARHERSMLGVALGLLDGRRELAREAVQDAWVRVIRHAARFDSRGSAQGWLLRITLNCARDIRKREARAAVVRTNSTATPRLAGPATSPGPPDDETTAALREALSRLDDDKREALLLSHHRGLPLETVAEIVGAPIGTVKSRVHAAKAALRAALASEVQP